MSKSLAVSITQNSQSTANNTSSITVKATCTCSGSSYRGSSRTGTYTIKVLDASGSTLKTYYNATSFTSGAAANSTTTLFSKTFTVTHDSTGYAKVSVSVTYDASSWNLTATGTKTLTTIARASSITSAAAVTLGNAVSIKWTPASSSFAYKLKFVVGSKSVTTGYITPNKTTAHTYSSYTMAIDDWAPYITTSTTATCTATLYTYTSSSSSTSIGSSSKTFTVTVPTSCVPSCESVAISEGNSAVGLGVYLTGQSKLKVVVTAKMSQSSPISSIVVKVGSTSYTASITTTSSGATGTITAAAQSSTSVDITVTVKDKRSRSGTYTTTVTQESYSIPAINNFTAVRCLADGTEDPTNGKCVKLTYQYTVSAVTNNTSAMSVLYAETTTGSYDTIVVSESGTFTGESTEYITEEIFSLETVYNFQITVTDAITSVSKTVRIATALVNLDFFKDGTGAAFGKVAETSGILESAWPIYINSESSSGLMITNTSDSGFCRIRVTNSWSGNAVELHAGSDGSNRGLYDPVAGNWIIYRDENNYTRINNTVYTNKNIIIDRSSESVDTQLYVISGSVKGCLHADAGGVFGVYNNTLSKRLVYHTAAGIACLGNTTYATYIYGSSIKLNTATTVAGRLTVTDSYIDVQDSGIALANALGVHHYLSSGTFVKCEYMNSSNQLCLGNNSYVTILYGSSVYLKGTSTAVTSDRRLKSDIEDLTDAHDTMFDSLIPRTFRLNSQPEKKHIGFIVQEVEEAMEAAGLVPEDYGVTSWFQTPEDEVSYGAITQDELIALLVYEVQKLKKQINA